MSAIGSRASNQQAEVEMLITGTRLCKLSVTAKVELVDPWIRDHVRVMVTPQRHRHRRELPLSMRTRRNSAPRLIS